VLCIYVLLDKFELDNELKEKLSWPQLEEQVAEVEKFYNSNKAQVNNVKDKGREKHVIGSRRSHQGASSKEPNSSNSMQEVMQQFCTIFHQASGNTLQLVFVISDFNCGLRLCTQDGREGKVISSMFLLTIRKNKIGLVDLEQRVREIPSSTLSVTKIND